MQRERESAQDRTVFVPVYCFVLSFSHFSLTHSLLPRTHYLWHWAYVYGARFFFFYQPQPLYDSVYVQHVKRWKKHTEWTKWNWIEKEVKKIIKNHNNSSYQNALHIQIQNTTKRCSRACFLIEIIFIFKCMTIKRKSEIGRQTTTTMMMMMRQTNGTKKNSLNVCVYFGLSMCAICCWPLPKKQKLLLQKKRHRLRFSIHLWRTTTDAATDLLSHLSYLLCHIINWWNCLITRYHSVQCPDSKSSSSVVCVFFALHFAFFFVIGTHSVCDRHNRSKPLIYLLLFSSCCYIVHATTVKRLVEILSRRLLHSSYKLFFFLIFNIENILHFKCHNNGQPAPCITLHCILYVVLHFITLLRNFIISFPFDA